MKLDGQTFFWTLVTKLICCCGKMYVNIIQETIIIMRKYFELYLTRYSPDWGCSWPIGRHIIILHYFNFFCFCAKLLWKFCMGFPCFRLYLNYWKTPFLLLKLNFYCHNTLTFNQFLEICLFPIIFLHFLWSPLLIWLSIENKKLIVRTYTWKYPQSDINYQIPLTPCPRLFNRLHWLVT